MYKQLGWLIISSLCISAAMAKLTGTELAMKAATEGIQIFGGYGYMMDSPMQRHFRDAKLTTIYEGPPRFSV